MGVSQWFNYALALFSALVVAVITGNAYFALLTFSLVAGVASYINPVTPDTQSPGEPQIGELRLSTAKEGDIIPDVLGTIKCTGNIFYYFGDNTVEMTETVPGGKGGGDVSITTGYKYYLSWCVGICLGPLDTLYAVYAGDTLVWSGELSRPESGGEETISLGNLEPELEETEVTINHEISIICDHSSSQLSVVTVGNPWLDSFGLDGPEPYDVEYQSATVTADWYDAEGIYLYTKTALVISRDRDEFYECGVAGSQAVNLLQVNLDPFAGGNIGEYYTNARLNITWTNTYDVSEQSTAMGSMTLYFGTDDQIANPTVANSLGDSTLCPAYRGLVWAFFNNNYIGRNNGCPTMRFVLGKRPVYAFSSLETINGYDYNPAHAVYHILHDDMHLGLDTEYSTGSTFAQVANTLSAENRGISALLESQQSARTYIEAFLIHMGGMLRSSSNE